MSDTEENEPSEDRAMNERLEQTETTHETDHFESELRSRIEAEGDAVLSAALAPLRMLHPTEELRLKNRRQLEAALVAEERRRLSPRVSLWRRTITLPLPVVVLLLTLAVIGGAVLAWWLGWLPKTASAPAGASMGFVWMARYLRMPVRRAGR